jgi:hypothetical protein
MYSSVLNKLLSKEKSRKIAKKCRKKAKAVGKKRLLYLKFSLSCKTARQF